MRNELVPGAETGQGHLFQLATGPWEHDERLLVGGAYGNWRNLLAAKNTLQELKARESSPVVRQKSEGQNRTLGAVPGAAIRKAVPTLPGNECLRDGYARRLILIAPQTHAPGRLDRNLLSTGPI